MSRGAVAAKSKMNPNSIQFKAALVAAYTDLFANDPDYAFSASKCTPEGLADKMLAACIGGTAALEAEKAQCGEAKQDSERLRWLFASRHHAIRVCMFPSFGWDKRVEENRPCIKEDFRGWIDRETKAASALPPNPTQEQK